MTTVVLTDVTDTGINLLVTVRPISGKRLIFYGWNDAVIKSVTPMPDGTYLLDGRQENVPIQNRACLAEIITAFEAMAVEI